MVSVDFAGFNEKSTISFAPYRNTRYAGVNSGCQTRKVDRKIVKVGSATRASQSQTSGENLKNSAKCYVAFSHHNCIYKATRPPAQVLELLLSRLKHSSQVIKYVLEEPDDVLTGGTERQRASPLSKHKHKTYRLPQMRHRCCFRPGDAESKAELGLWVSRALRWCLPGAASPRALLQGSP